MPHLSFHSKEHSHCNWERVAMRNVLQWHQEQEVLIRGFSLLTWWLNYPSWSDRPDWSFLWLELLVIGWGWNGVWWGQEKKRWTWAWGHKKFLETQTITLQLQLFRELCALQKKAEGFFCPLSGQLAYVYIWQSIGIKTLFSVFLAGSKPMEVQQLPLDELKNT